MFAQSNPEIDLTMDSSQLLFQVLQCGTCGICVTVIVERFARLNFCPAKVLQKVFCEISFVYKLHTMMLLKYFKRKAL